MVDDVRERGQPVGDPSGTVADDLDPLEVTAVLNAMPSAVCIYDADDRILFWNQRYLELFPWHRDAMFVGRRYEDALRVFFESNLSKAELPNLEEHLQSGVERHKNLREPFVFQTKLGVWVVVSPLRLPSGKYVKIWSEFMSRSLDASGYRDLLDSITAINIGFAAFDSKGEFVFCNYRLSELIPDSVNFFTPGRTFEDFIATICDLSLDQTEARSLLQRSERAFPHRRSKARF